MNNKQNMIAMMILGLLLLKVFAVSKNIRVERLNNTCTITASLVEYDTGISDVIISF